MQFFFAINDEKKIQIFNYQRPPTMAIRRTIAQATTE